MDICNGMDWNSWKHIPAFKFSVFVSVPP